ncbi:M14 family metallopeptidase [Aliidiomarina maris]|uniref:Zinc carboxypeptidase n=1 Tax=Aliidiomarina maris TaxID=531312 RepID=A0A327X5A8_9GAMM|nr:M14 family metallopeptidase [Aliidiomarina maris]RAK00715.1 zinc carboxypeptidase [Aliidiomarina maris]RUO27286.1 hypothetical protein CWE07_04880 [Aliidiomarina maris]
MVASLYWSFLVHCIPQAACAIDRDIVARVVLPFSQANAPANHVTCDFSDIRFSAQFPQGRFGRCERGSDGRLIVHLEPESYPINPSPWHAFTVEADRPRHIDIEIRSEHANTRYSPKLSYDRDTWKVMEYKRQGSSQFFSLEVGEQLVWIAGQELFDNNDYAEWMRRIHDEYPSLEKVVLGQSVEGQDIAAFVHHGQSHEWLIVLGRQHPPEVTGAMALQAFVEFMLQPSETSEAFLRRYNILIVPNMNPDGVALGNWRYNANQVDLNRNWLKRDQPEVQAVHAFLRDRVDEGARLVYGVDFHSTFRDVFYTTPGSYLTNEPDFSYDWLNLLAAAAAPNAIVEQPSANPNLGNFKQYMADYFGVHAVTYEVADNADRLAIRLIARHAADTLMMYMLTREMPILIPSY